MTPTYGAAWILLALALGACAPERDAQRAPDGAPVGAAASADSLGRRPEDAVATVRSYLAALSQRDFARAALLWDEGADPGAGDSAAFHRAHGDTTITAFGVGEPGRVDGAAGSRAIEVPVTIEGTAPERPPLRLHGRVTLRRSEAEGASEAARRWRIARIEWSSNAKPPQPR
jgi:hypothetical protein